MTPQPIVKGLECKKPSLPHPKKREMIYPVAHHPCFWHDPPPDIHDPHQRRIAENKTQSPLNDSPHNCPPFQATPGPGSSSLSPTKPPIHPQPHHHDRHNRRRRHEQQPADDQTPFAPPVARGLVFEEGGPVEWGRADSVGVGSVLG
ncbi:MAG: hypothetical protein LQ350_000098 [Teloschistes chrysophthalmus]|nr:MAG: hypothetical protein LQ350_000098 [Niorma chrysophthalma]